MTKPKSKPTPDAFARMPKPKTVSDAFACMLQRMVGKRVRVRSGDGRRKLGEGTYVANVTIYAILMPDGSLRSLRNAEQRPSEDIVPIGGRVIPSEHNPKIRLDSGRIVYGCQVWWELVEQKPERKLEVACTNVRRILRRKKP